MITKIKMVTSLLNANNIIPVRYNGEEIGMCFVSEDKVTMVIDKHEQEFKNAFSEPGLSGFSLEVTVHE